MWLLVEMEYILQDTLQVNLLTWLYLMKIICISPNTSSQQIKLIKSDPMCNE